MTRPPPPRDHAAPVTPLALGQAAAHVGAAAELLAASDTSGQIFSPTRGLAAQLQLIGHGLSPGVAPATDAFAPVGTPAAHVDHALRLLDELEPASTPADLFLWRSRLSDLRPRLTTLAAPDS